MCCGSVALLYLYSTLAIFLNNFGHVYSVVFMVHDLVPLSAIGNCH